jgi:mono/diheme cytochrome c family protein
MKPMILVAALILFSAVAVAASSRQTILEVYAKEAGVTAFSPERGKAFFEAAHKGGKPATPSCTTCHGINLREAGQTRAGKLIDPMAVSANPDRFTDAAFVEKWFSRNCDSVLGRPCTATEKGDVITYLASL